MQAVYKDRKKIEAEIKKQPALGAFSDFEYGFKIRDKEVPSSWYGLQSLACQLHMTVCCRDPTCHRDFGRGCGGGVNMSDEGYVPYTFWTSFPQKLP